MTDRADSGGQQTMLIVEDQALLRQTLRDFLQNAFPDCTVKEAPDGASALETCNAYRPILVLMDKCLPDVDGIELTARLKICFPGIQVIVMSYRKDEIYVQRALEAGAFAYLVKDRLATDLIPAMAAAMGILPATDIGAL